MREKIDKKQPTTNSLDLIGTHEAMKVFGYRDKGRFLGMVKRCGIPHYRVGCGFRYRKTEIESWLSSQKVKVEGNK